MQKKKCGLEKCAKQRVRQRAKSRRMNGIMPQKAKQSSPLGKRGQAAARKRWTEGEGLGFLKPEDRVQNNNIKKNTKSDLIPLRVVLLFAFFFFF